MKNTGLLTAAFFCFLLAGAQSFKYRNYNFEWAPGHPAAIPVEEPFKNEDAVILDEKCIYNAVDDVSPVVQKHVRIKFLTQRGVKKFSTVVLPESFDPSSDWSTVRPENRDTIYRPKGEFECIRYFAARIIKPDGKIGLAVLDEKTQLEINRHNQIDSKIYSWIFRVINLEPGDELELDYSYEGAFNYDPSTRIFFNGELPKQNFNLTFKYPQIDYYTLSYANGAHPIDSVMETKTRPRSTEYYFTGKNLVGGIREAGGRPYTQFPYISYYKNLRDYGFMDKGAAYITRPLPYPWAFVLRSWVKYKPQSLRSYLSATDRTTVALNDFFAKEKSNVKDTSMAAIMSSIHHKIAVDFNYQDDKRMHEGDDQENEHLGKYLENSTLREVSRHRMYDELMLRLDRDYYAALFCDKRISVFDMNEYKYTSSLRSGYAIPFNKNFIFLYPKSYRFGYETNELPFYYEDIQSVLVPQHEPTEKSYDAVPDVSVLFVNTPFSGVKDNIRITSGMVNVSLDSTYFTLSARIKLSGQFSTLMRGYYLYGDQDSTINPDYFNTLASLADEGKPARVSVTSTEKLFPYDASVSIDLSNHTAITKETDGTFSIDLDGWFNNVIDEDFTAINRHLDYYPDFQFQDSHKYMLKFDKKIQLVNAELLQKNISNGFADYMIKISQTGEESILIESSYVVKPEYAPATHARDVQDVFDAIKKINNSSLKIKTI